MKGELSSVTYTLLLKNIFSLRKRENDRLHASEARFQGYEEVKPYIVDDEEDFFPTRNNRNETYSSATITKHNIRSRSPMALVE